MTRAARSGRRSFPNRRRWCCRMSPSSAIISCSTSLENVMSRIEIRDLDGKFIRDLKLPGIGTAGAGGDPDHDELFYDFDNFTDAAGDLSDQRDRSGADALGQDQFPGRSVALHGGAEVVHLEGRHARSRCSSFIARTCRSMAARRSCSTATAVSASTMMPDFSRRVLSRGSRRAAASPSSTCAAAASSASSGTRTACC